MSEVKIMVTELPESPSDCPFSVWDCENGYLCGLNAGGSIVFQCSLDRNKECNKLIAPFTFGNYEGEENEETNTNIVLFNDVR